MVYDLTMLKAFYTLYEGKIERIRTILQRPLTLAEKILYAHLYDEKNVKDYKRGEDYVNFRPDRSGCNERRGLRSLRGHGSDRRGPEQTDGACGSAQPEGYSDP